MLFDIIFSVLDSRMCTKIFITCLLDEGSGYYSSLVVNIFDSPECHLVIDVPLCFGGAEELFVMGYFFAFESSAGSLCVHSHV